MSLSSSVIIAYSGHSFVVAEAAKMSGIPLGYYTDIEEKINNPFQLEYLGDESREDSLVWQNNYDFILGIGSNKIRKRIGELLVQKGKNLLNIVHPQAAVSSYFMQGKGNFIARNVSVSPLVKIGNFCILNTSCVVEHECQISDAVHVGPGAVLAGNVKVGAGSFIGANAVVRQGISIGKNVVIGAGAVIINDVEDNKIIVGNPGKEKTRI